MGHLQALLTATCQEKLIPTDPHGDLYIFRTKKLGNAAALLCPSVFQNHMTHLQEVMQATSEQVCWKTILDELLTNETLTETARLQQANYLTAQIEDTSNKLQTAIERAQSWAGLQNQHRSNSDGS